MLGVVIVTVVIVTVVIVTVVIVTVIIVTVMIVATVGTLVLKVTVSQSLPIKKIFIFLHLLCQRPPY